MLNAKSMRKFTNCWLNKVCPLPYMKVLLSFIVSKRTRVCKQETLLLFSNIIRMSQTNMSMLYSSENEFFQSVAAAIEKKDQVLL